MTLINNGGNNMHASVVHSADLPQYGHTTGRLGDHSLRRPHRSIGQGTQSGSLLIPSRVNPSARDEEASPSTLYSDCL
jgi:hypothetical protein